MCLLSVIAIINKFIINQLHTMSLFLITVMQRIAANRTVLEKGMTVEVSAFMQSDLFSNGSVPVRNAFMNKYGVDLMKLGGPGAIWQYFDIKKIS